MWLGFLLKTKLRENTTRISQMVRGLTRKNKLDLAARWRSFAVSFRSWSNANLCTRHDHPPNVSAL